MSSVLNYVMISLALVLFLEFAGIPTGASEIFTLAGIQFNEDKTIKNVTSGGIFDTLVGDADGDGLNAGLLITLIGIGVGAVLAGLFTRAKPENLIILPFITGTLTVFAQTTYSVIRYSIGIGSPWVAAIVVLIFLPLTVGFIVSFINYFRGVAD